MSEGGKETRALSSGPHRAAGISEDCGVKSGRLSRLHRFSRTLTERPTAATLFLKIVHAAAQSAETGCAVNATQKCAGPPERARGFIINSWHR